MAAYSYRVERIEVPETEDSGSLKDLKHMTQLGGRRIVAVLEQQRVLMHKATEPGAWALTVLTESHLL